MVSDALIVCSPPLLLATLSPTPLLRTHRWHAPGFRLWTMGSSETVSFSHASFASTGDRLLAGELFVPVLEPLLADTTVAAVALSDDTAAAIVGA